MDGAMKITDTRPAAPVGRRRAVAGGADPAAGAEFARWIEAGGERPAAPAPAAPPSTLAGLLALQEVPDPAIGRRQGVDRGRGLLAELHELRLALIDGWLPEPTLRRLAAALEAGRPQTGSPGLDAVLDEIELRAAVEIAKAELERG
jgi:hypothetical protein